MINQAAGIFMVVLIFLSGCEQEVAHSPESMH